MGTKKEKAINDAARKIRNAWKNGKTIKPIRDFLPKGDIDAAYAIQQKNTNIWIKEGRRVIGRKIGASLAVDEPCATCPSAFNSEAKETTSCFAKSNS